MIYGSVCSGIEAATVAWHPLGWKPSFFSEIDRFPRAVLGHHYPEVPLHGDFTTIEAGQYGRVDLLVGGTPCQSFSIAGKRLGLDDPRGNLAIEYARLALRLRAKWIVWENVPGVLSSNGGRDFGAFLGILGESGYGWAYRILDAQYVRVDGFPRAVPQQRRRLILVGYLGNWRRAAAVLFEREGLRRDPPPRREATQRLADTLTVGANQYSGFPGEPVESLIPSRSMCLNAGGMGRVDAETETLIPVARCLRAKSDLALREDADTLVAHTLRAAGFDASEDGTGRGTPLVPVYSPRHAATLTRRAESAGNGGYAGRRQEDDVNLVAFDARQSDVLLYGDKTGPLDTHGSSIAVLSRMAVRRLTPRECERLQGFPDDYTSIPYRNKPAADGPRYKALGNSMAVNVMRWIGMRIALVDAIEGDR